MMTPPRALRVFALVLPLVTTACSRDPDPASTTATSASALAALSARPEPSTVASAAVERAPQPERPYNVVLITIDALRADMPWAGYPRDIAPRLTAFEKRATSYPRAYSFSSYTAKSVAPMLGGRYPTEMKRDGRFFTKWMQENDLVSERAQRAGHRTLAGQGHGIFLKGFGLEQGFDDYRLLPGTFLDTKGVFDVTSERLNKLAKEMLSAPENVQLADGKRFFAYFHFLDPHYAYYKHKGHPDFGNERRDVYDNEVHFTDHWVGDLIDWIETQPWGDKTAIIVSADHGEGFGEHGHYRHTYEVWEALVRVPLMIRVPGATPRRIELARGHVDLAPTIGDLMGLPPDEGWRGTSLVPEVFGEEATERPVIVDLPRCDLMDRRRALVSGDYKLIAFGNDARFSLYNVVKDFREDRELSKEEPETLERMKRLYREMSEKIPNMPVVGDAPLMGAPTGQRW